MKKLILGIFISITFNAFAQQQIYATTYNLELYSFNLTNCTRQFKGYTGLFLDIAFTPNGKLWGINGSQLYQIDTATAKHTFVGSIPIPAVSLVEYNDTILLAEYNMKLYSINILNAKTSEIGLIGYSADGDLTWYDDDLYMVTSQGQIVKIELDVPKLKIINVTKINNSTPKCEGAITASFTGEYNSIIGFNYENIIKICHLDGTSQMLCPNINPGNITGGASIRLAKQTPLPNSCKKTVSINNPSVNELISIFQNSEANSIYVKCVNESKFNYKIYNIQGQPITSGIIESNENTIDIGYLRNGIYLIDLSADNFVVRKKFFVEK